MSEIAITSGDVPFEVDGEQHVLKCTLRAAMQVNDAFANYSTAVVAIQRMDFAGVANVVAAGLDKPIGEARAIVFRKGHRNLVEPVSKYLIMLANGGRPVEDITNDKKDAAPGEG